jgi:hypothetical protein
MKARTIFLALLLAAGLTTATWADGRIWGHITYTNCDCDVHDKVCIKPASGGDCIMIPVICSPGPYYTSYPYTIPPGSYWISVVLHEGSNCTNSAVNFFVHGSQSEECDLQVFGPSGGITNPEPGP